MNRRRILTFICPLLAILSLAAGWRLFAPSPVGVQSDTKLLVSAAISLKEALEEIKPQYLRTNPAVNITYNFGASGALQQQIEQGAPVDIFASAAKKQMDALQQKGLILTDTRRDLLTNEIVLIVPQDASGITSFRQLADSQVKKIAIGEPKSVPVGQYAEEVFKNLGILAQVRPKFVLGNNVRQVLAAVESGSVDAGVVYTTDARTSNRVKTVTTAPRNSHSPIVYPIAVIKDSKNIPAAKKYLQFLLGNPARQIFQKYGFGTL
jgi:molybdate transport system substrate-binding protein